MLPALADKLGVDPPSEVTIRLYKNDHVFRTSIALPFPAVEWVPAWANGEASVKIRLDDQAASQEYQAILARYLAWHLLCRMGVDSEWLLKGASTYLAGAVDGGANARQATQSLSKVLDAALEGDLYALAALPPDHQLVSSSEFRIAKSLSYDTTNYLAETYGYQTLLQLLQSQAYDQDVDTVLRSLVGSTLSKFEAEWSESLARGHALPEWIEIARSFDPDAANQHVEYLASRQLAGRQAGSPGAELASAYIAARFVEYGLVPANGVTQTGQEPTPTRFYQRFPITYTTWISSPNLQVHGLDGQVDESLVHRQDFVAIVDQVSGEGSVAGDLLWVRSTDWQGIDLNGKIVVCDASESPQIQVSRAIEHGASGLILIGNKAGRRSVLAKSPLPTTNSLSQTIPTLELTRQGAARLLEAAGQTQGSLAASPPALHLGLKATVDVPLSTPVTVETANVLGLLPGSDPKLSQEIVIVGAHYDHVGDDPGTTGPGTAGRRYAGANDNASGIGVLLEIARLWQETGYRPRRSVLFVAWGAQEPGEIGSTCYVTHPAFPLESTVAVFQLDGVGGGRGYFLEAQGDPAQEGLLRFVLEAAETQVDGRLTLTRPSDRSDDRPFRQAGIPTVLLTWRESSEDNLPAEQADPVESYRLGVTGRMVSLALMTLFGSADISEEMWEELEELLIQADVGVDTTIELVEQLRERVDKEHVVRADKVRDMLQEELLALLPEDTPRNDLAERLLTVILVVGVNGSGKTTTIAKLTHYYRERGKRVVLAAADTFRAAAIDQLKIWGERTQVDVIAHSPGSDPGAVVYDAIQAAQSRKANILIVDTAGRLHTKYNLMQELKKVRSVMTKNVHRAPHETWLVLDATTGQNGLAQARQFKEEIGVTGLIVAKLDSTAKGGIVFAISKELALPIRFVCTGESIDDLAEFDAGAFVEGIFG
jgi:fused signal recognition particle receptor